MEENPSSSRSSNNSQFGGTPRETQFYSPRDDRFVSPRQEALRSSRTASSDEKWDNNNTQWSTPREENRVMRASSSMEKMASDHWSTPRSDRPSPRHPYPLQRQSSNSSDEYNSARSQYDDRNNPYNNTYQSSQPYYTQPQQPSSSSSYMLQPQASNLISLSYSLSTNPQSPNLTYPGVTNLINTNQQTDNSVPTDDECPIDVVRGQLPDLAQLGVSSPVSRPPAVPTSAHLPQQHTCTAGNFV